MNAHRFTRGRRALAMVLVPVSLVGGLFTAAGSADAATSLAVKLEAHCYSTTHSVDMAVFRMDNSPYPRAVRVMFRNEDDTAWRAATGWYQFGAGDISTPLVSWNAGASGWHQYAPETLALTSSGWESQGTALAHADSALTQGGTPSWRDDGWCHT